MNILTPVQVGMIGMGVVGTGVARILVQHADRITRRAGRPIRLKRVAVRDTGRTRDVELPAGVISGDAADLIQDPEISIVVQLMGGVDLARQQILAALTHGKDIVTANKAVLAEHGTEIFDHALRLGRSVAYDAAVAGGIPIVSNIGQ
ncbi:MAG: homoserine dehydrogenase, partial [Planctomycetota bacterium]|nr:homoserine dehydrogenase [Planctomycetota bacterium]